MEGPNKLGERLREARKRLRLSQTATAKYVGVSRQTVAIFEQGERSPNTEQLVKFANIYRQTLDQIVLGSRPLPSGQKLQFHTRQNDPTQQLHPQDLAELEEFSAYLQRRRVTAPPLNRYRKPLESIESVARRWLKDEDVPNIVPVPVFAMLAKHGIEVRFTSLATLAGALILGTAQHPPGILINSDQPYYRQRYSASHELGHILLDHQPQDQHAFVSFLGRRTDPIEAHADCFASELPIPQKQLEDRIDKLPPQEPIAHRVSRLASAFMVSFQAMTFRLATIDALSPSEREELETAKPNSIEAELGLNKRPNGKHFDTNHIAALVKQIPESWGQDLGPDVVRLLQEIAYAQYTCQHAEEYRTDPANAVYEKVALWVADHRPMGASNQSRG